jgi:hypothetical protein
MQDCGLVILPDVPLEDEDRDNGEHTVVMVEGVVLPAGARVRSIATGSDLTELDRRP